MIAIKVIDKNESIPDEKNYILLSAKFLFGKRPKLVKVKKFNTFPECKLYRFVSFFKIAPIDTF